MTRNGDVEWVITNRALGEDQDLAGDTQARLTLDNVQKESAVRWQIEQLHRELKQLVGTEKCQCRKARAQRNHLACCYLAWLTLRVHACKVGTTLYTAHANLLWELLRDFLRAQLRQPTITAIPDLRNSLSESPKKYGDGQKPLSDNAVWKLVLRRVRTAGIADYVTPHSTRHAFITLALDGRAPLHKVQAAAGHADPRTTERYWRTRQNLDDNAVDYVQL